MTMSGGSWVEKAERANWLPPLLQALAPDEAQELSPQPSAEGVVPYLVRVARRSRRAKARQIALANLFPAARDRLEGVTQLAVDRLLNDPGKFVTYEACRLLALAHDPATLGALRDAWDQGIEVPRNGIEDAYRAVEQGDRDGFYNRPGWPGHTGWVIQDERTDFANGGRIVCGSAAYGTVVR